MISLQLCEENPRTKLTLLADTNLAKTSLTTYAAYLKYFFRWSEIVDEQEFLVVKDSDLQILMDMYVKFLKKKSN